MTANEKAPGDARDVPGAENSIPSPASLQSNSGAAQRHRILARLRSGAATTIELRRNLDCLMPAARIFELRHRQGFNIQAVWIDQPTDCGRTHRVALYSLHPGAYRPGPAPDACNDGSPAPEAL